MKFWKLDDLKHENEHIYYYKIFSGNIYLGNEEAYKIYPVRFAIETHIGGKEIKELEIFGKPEYPKMELKKKVEEYIKENLI